MALCALSDDALGVIYVGLINVLDPGVAVDFSSASKGLWEPTQAMRQQLRTDYEAVAALCLKIGMRSCTELRKAWKVVSYEKNLSAADLETLGKLGSVLPALEQLILGESPGAAVPGGVQRVVAGLGAGALPAVTSLNLVDMYAGDAGASAPASPTCVLLSWSTVTAGSAPAPSPAISRCTPSGPAAPAYSARSSCSSAGSTEPSVASVARSAAERPLFFQ